MNSLRLMLTHGEVPVREIVRNQYERPCLSLIAPSHMKPKATDSPVFQLLEGLRCGATEEANRYRRGAKTNIY